MMDPNISSAFLCRNPGYLLSCHMDLLVKSCSIHAHSLGFRLSKGPVTPLRHAAGEGAQSRCCLTAFCESKVQDLNELLAQSSTLCWRLHSVKITTVGCSYQDPKRMQNNGPKPLKRAQKAIVLHIFGVQACLKRFRDAKHGLRCTP